MLSSSDTKYKRHVYEIIYRSCEERHRAQSRRVDKYCFSYCFKGIEMPGYGNVSMAYFLSNHLNANLMHSFSTLTAY